MASKPIQIVGAFLVALAKPISAQTADSPVDVKQLQEENRRLKQANAALTKSVQQLRQTNDALLKTKASKDATSRPTLATRSPASQPQQMKNTAAPPPTESVAEEGLEDSGLPGAKAASWLTFKDEVKPWSVNVGTRVWVNQWEADLVASHTYFTATPLSRITVQSNSNYHIQSRSYEPTPIPYASARYGRLMLSGSYYAATDFTFYPFHNQFVATPLSPASSPIINDLQFNMRNRRSEWDVAVGYFFLKHLALTVGYKNFAIDFKNAFRTNYLTNDSLLAYNEGNSTANNRFYGPTLGMSGSAPIGGNFSVYGSYAHGFLEYSFTNQLRSQNFRPDGSPNGNASATKAKFGGVDADYDVAELGIIYSPDVSFLGDVWPLQGVSMFAGYKYQRIHFSLPSSEYGNENTLPVKADSDTTSGFVSGINLTF